MSWEEVLNYSALCLPPHQLPSPICFPGAGLEPRGMDFL